jgi:hypothetical protein
MQTTMSVTRALAELKTLQKRIQKFNSSVFINVVTSNRYSSPSASEADMRSDWDAVNALIERYRAIKFAILQSNAVTKVRVGSKTYTVAEAIALKESMKHEQELLDTLRRQRVSVTNTVETHNQAIQHKLDSLLEINFKERKTSEDDIKTIKDAYLKNNEIRVVDPLKIDARIAEMESRLEEFRSNVDFCLSESNAVTTITV